MRLVAGCDGGGTKCAVRVARVNDANEIAEVGTGVAGGANVSTDFETAVQNICSATRDALASIGAAPDTTVESFVAALAGSTRVSHDHLRERLQAELNIKRVKIVPDVAVLFAAAGVSPPALATIVGTGSIAWRVAKSGKTFRAGGEGPTDSDHGSGFWIGRESVRRGLIRADLGETSTPQESARFSAEAFSRRGELGVDSLLDEAATHIAELILDVSQQARRDLVSCPWVCAGGVAVNQKEWMELVRTKCSEKGCELPEPIFVKDPVIGAQRMAVEL